MKMNDNFILTDIKFSKQADNTTSVEAEKNSDIKEVGETEFTNLKEVPTDIAMEQRLQDKIEKMRGTYEENEDKGLMNKIFGFFKK